MRILFLTQIIPYPPDAGPKVKTWHVLRYLVEAGHQVILASFMRPEEAPYVPKLEALCEAVYTVPINRSRFADVRYWLQSHLTGRPFLIERDDLPGMRRVVAEVLEQHAVDVIHADQLTMTQYAFQPQSVLQRMATPTIEPMEAFQKDGLQTIFDAHNAVWTIVERMQKNAPWFLKPVLAVEADRIKRYEGFVVKHCATTLAVTEQDRVALEAAVQSLPEEHSNSAANIAVIPIAVDTVTLTPVQRRAGSKNIVTLGTLHYPPNADGIRWFAVEVFPLIQRDIPDVTLTIIGKNPPADFLELAKNAPDAVQVTGYVPDLDPYMAEAALMVVPVRAGGGMRVRILEAFARAMPVATTTVGIEGITANGGEDAEIEDDPEKLAAAIVNILNDPHLQEKLARNGRRLAVEKYDWQVVLKSMNAIYDRKE